MRPGPAFDTGDGWSIEAGVRIRAGDREGLEHLARYVLRPAIAQERLFDLGDGRYQYLFRRPRWDQADSMILTGVELVEKLAALIPRPRAHLLRYHGVLAPHARERKATIPPEPVRESFRQRPKKRRKSAQDDEAPRPSGRGRRKPTPWAELLRRTFGIDVLQCPRCGSRREVIACLTKAAAIRRILQALGLPADPPRAAPARPPPQRRFEFDQGRDEAV